MLPGRMIRIQGLREKQGRIFVAEHVDQNLSLYRVSQEATDEMASDRTEKVIESESAICRRA